MLDEEILVFKYFSRSNEGHWLITKKIFLKVLEKATNSYYKSHYFTQGWTDNKYRFMIPWALQSAWQKQYMALKYPYFY